MENNPLFEQFDALNLSSDRQSGIRLLSDALCTDHAVSQVVMYVRFFEAAFGTNANLARWLHKFLAAGGMKVTLEEVGDWITLRNGSAHSKLDVIPKEGGVRYLVPFVRHAAYDVLLHKARWGKRCLERTGSFAARSRDPERKVSMRFIFLDPLGGYRTKVMCAEDGRALEYDLRPFFSDRYRAVVLKERLSRTQYKEAKKRVIEASELRVIGGVHFFALPHGETGIRMSVTKDGRTIEVR